MKVTPSSTNGSVDPYIKGIEQTERFERAFGQDASTRVKMPGKHASAWNMYPQRIYLVA